MKREKLKKPKRAMKIRAKIVTYLTVFTGVSLLLLLLFQILFIDDFYEAQKVSAIEDAAEEIAESVDTSGIGRIMEYWSADEQFNTYLVEQDGQIRLSSVSFSEADAFLLPQELDQIYAKTALNGEYLQKKQISMSALRDEGITPKPQRGERYPMEEKPPENEPPAKKTTPSAAAVRPEIKNVVIYARMAGETMVLVTAVITPMDATIQTLAIQFLLAAVVLIFFAVLLGWIVAGQIARPIRKINDAAKDLSAGTYHSPQTRGYREIDELCETLERVSEELKKTEQLQRDLIANVSHDLRTPLTMITGYSEAIRDLPGEDSAENIQVVIDEAHRLTDLVNDVLDLSKLQSGTQPLAADILDLSEIVTRVVLRCETMVSACGYHIEWTTSDEALVKGDEGRLAQVIYNLLGNALAYTGADKTVRVTQECTDTHVRVCVTDSGKGISEEEQALIWQRYYRSESVARKRQILGTGLGLSIVYNVVTLHGGQCGVESTIGKGSTFWFELPLAVAEE